MILKSDKVTIKASRNEIISLLTDCTKLVHLLPQDKITDWQADTDQCSFKIQGGITISLIQNGKEGESQIFLKSGEKSPFPFKLTIFLENINEETEGYIQFDGEVNMFLKMVVEKPLLNLFNFMTQQLKDQY